MSIQNRCFAAAVIFFAALGGASHAQDLSVCNQLLAGGAFNEQASMSDSMLATSYVDIINRTRLFEREITEQDIENRNRNVDILYKTFTLGASDRNSVSALNRYRQYYLDILSQFRSGNEFAQEAMEASARTASEVIVQGWSDCISTIARTNNPSVTRLLTPNVDEIFVRVEYRGAGGGRFQIDEVLTTAGISCDVNLPLALGSERQLSTFRCERQSGVSGSISYSANISTVIGPRTISFVDPPAPRDPNPRPVCNFLAPGGTEAICDGLNLVGFINRQVRLNQPESAEYCSSLGYSLPTRNEMIRLHSLGLNFRSCSFLWTSSRGDDPIRDGIQDYALRSLISSRDTPGCGSRIGISFDAEPDPIGKQYPAACMR